MKNHCYHHDYPEYDCGPTSMMNAIAYLFEREEIPPGGNLKYDALRLDCHSKEGIPGKRDVQSCNDVFKQLE